MSGHKLVRVLTVIDLLSAFLFMLEALQSSSRLDLALPEDPEAYEKACGLIKAAGGEIINVGLGAPQAGGGTDNLARQQWQQLRLWRARELPNWPKSSEYLKSLFPVVRPAVQVGNGNDKNFFSLQLINNTLGGRPGSAPSGPFGTGMPRLWKSGNSIQTCQDFRGKVVTPARRCRIILANSFIQFDPGDLQEPDPQGNHPE